MRGEIEGCEREGVKEIDLDIMAGGRKGTERVLRGILLSFLFLPSVGVVKILSTSLMISLLHGS